VKLPRKQLVPELSHQQIRLNEAFKTRENWRKFEIICSFDEKIAVFNIFISFRKNRTYGTNVKIQKQMQFQKPATRHSREYVPPSGLGHTEFGTVSLMHCKRATVRKQKRKQRPRCKFCGILNRCVVDPMIKLRYQLRNLINSSLVHHLPIPPNWVLSFNCSIWLIDLTEIQPHFYRATLW